MLWGIIYGYIKSGMKFSPLYRLDKIPTGSNEPARNSPAAESAKGRMLTAFACIGAGGLWGATVTPGLDLSYQVKTILEQLSHLTSKCYKTGKHMLL